MRMLMIAIALTVTLSGCCSILLPPETVMHETAECADAVAWAAVACAPVPGFIDAQVCAEATADVAVECGTDL